MSSRDRRWLWMFLLALPLALLLAYTPSIQATAEVWRLQRLGLSELEALVRGNPAGAEARYRLGLAYARQGRHREAAREFLQVLEQSPTRADVLNDLGAAYLLQERYYESLIALQGALTVRPDYGVAYANLGRLHLATEMPFTGVRELEQAARLSPGDAAILCDLGEAYQRTLNMNAAISAYQKALKREPKSLTARVGMGRALFALTRYAEAERELAAALDRQPGDPLALLTLGRMRLERATTPDQLRAALDLLQQAADGDQADPEARYDLGRVCLRLGEPREAVKHFREALRRSPEHPGALYQYGRALRATGETDEADRIEKLFRERSLLTREETRLEEQIHQNPEDWNARAELAEIYLRAGKTGLVALMLRQLKDGAPAHSRLGELQRALGRQSALREGRPAKTGELSEP